MSSFLDNLADLERRFNELDHLMADPAIATDPVRAGLAGATPAAR